MPQTRTICPYCGAVNIVGDKVISFRCSNCNEIVNCLPDQSQVFINRRKRTDNNINTNSTSTTNSNNNINIHYTQTDEARIKEVDSYKRKVTFNGVSNILSSFAQVLEALLKGLASLIKAIGPVGWIALFFIIGYLTYLSKQ